MTSMLFTTPTLNTSNQGKKEAFDQMTGLFNANPQGSLGLFNQNSQGMFNPSPTIFGGSQGSTFSMQGNTATQGSLFGPNQSLPNSGQGQSPFGGFQNTNQPTSGFMGGNTNSLSFNMNSGGGMNQQQQQNGFGQLQPNSGFFNKPAPLGTGLQPQTNSMTSGFFTQPANGLLNQANQPMQMNQQQNQTGTFFNQQNTQSGLLNTQQNLPGGQFFQQSQNLCGSFLNQQPASQPNCLYNQQQSSPFNQFNQQAALPNNGSLFNQQPNQSTNQLNQQTNQYKGLFPLTSQPSSFFNPQQNQQSSVFNPSNSVMNQSNQQNGFMTQTVQTNTMLTPNQPNTNQGASSASSLFPTSTHGTLSGGLFPNNQQSTQTGSFLQTTQQTNPTGLGNLFPQPQSTLFNPAPHTTNLNLSQSLTTANTSLFPITQPQTQSQSSQSLFNPSGNQSQSLFNGPQNTGIPLLKQPKVDGAGSAINPSNSLTNGVSDFRLPQQQNGLFNPPAAPITNLPMNSSSSLSTNTSLFNPSSSNSAINKDIASTPSTSSLFPIETKPKATETINTQQNNLFTFVAQLKEQSNTVQQPQSSSLFPNSQTTSEKPSGSTSLFPPTQPQPQSQEQKPSSEPISLANPTQEKSSLFAPEAKDSKDKSSSLLFAPTTNDKKEIKLQSAVNKLKDVGTGLFEEKKEEKTTLKDSLNPNLIEKLRQHIKTSLSLYSSESYFDSLSDPYSDSFSEIRYSLLNRKKQKSNTKSQLNKSQDANNIITLYIKFTDNNKDISFLVKIREKASVKTLIEVIESNLIKEHSIDLLSSSRSLFLMKNHVVIPSSQGLLHNNIKNNDTLFAVLNTFEETKESTAVPKKTDLAPESSLPKLTRKEYKTIPEMKEIYRMTSKQLSHILPFAIFNPYGKIEFEEEVDLTGIDLDEIVEIGLGYVKVYKNTLDYPNPGEGLNKPAIVHMYHMLPGLDEKLENYLKKLQLKCKEMKAEFKSYNEKNGELVYKIEHF